MDQASSIASGGKTALILAFLDEQRVSELAQLARLSGCTVVAGDMSRAAHFLLADIRSGMETNADILSEIVEYLSDHDSIALVWTDLLSLEAVYAALPADRCHFFVDGGDYEALPVLTGAYGQSKKNRLHERDREADFASLHEISGELARFAQMLARMADGEGRAGLSDKPVSFRPAPAAGFQPFPTSRATPADPQSIRETIRLRRLRSRFFGEELFADPAWDILLDLKAAMLEGRKVSVSSLCIAAAVPPTTALRWIAAMTESGMLVRHQDPDDARRVFITLSEESSGKLDDYLAAIGKFAAPPI